MSNLLKINKFIESVQKSRTLWRGDCVSA